MTKLKIGQTQFQSDKRHPQGDEVQPEQSGQLNNAITHYSLVVDNFHVIKGSGYFKQSLKKAMLNLQAFVVPIVGGDLKIIENLIETEEEQRQSESIMSEEEIFTRYIAMLQVPKKNLLDAIVIAWNENPKLVSSIATECFKKAEVKPEGSQYTDNQRQFLRVLDYTVNLIFLREFTNNIKVHTYDNTKMKAFVNQVLEELRPVLKRDFRLIFKSEEELDLISQYESIVMFLKDTRTEQRTTISQLVDAWNHDKKAMEGIIKK